MIITEEFIDSGDSGNGGWNKKQLALIGVTWPPRQGWKYRVIGNEISDNDAREFVELRGATKKKRVKKKSTNKREPLSKRIRFEVFKRDRFTCQYCGKKAPDVVLHVDHIEPVSKGGKNEITNLITSCKDCNLGKGPRRLSESAEVEKQRREIEETHDRREQLELLKQWRDEVRNVDAESVEYFLHQFISFGGIRVNKQELSQVKRALKKYGIREMLDALDYVINWHEDKYGKINQRRLLGDIRKRCYYRSIYGENASRIFYISAIAINNYYGGNDCPSNVKWDLRNLIYQSTNSGKVALDKVEYLARRNNVDDWVNLINSLEDGAA